MHLEFIWDKKAECQVPRVPFEAGCLWVGGGISSVKASASIIQCVVQLWMTSTGATPPGACSTNNNGVMCGGYMLLTCRLTAMSTFGLESHPAIDVDRALQVVPHSPESTRQTPMC